MIGCCYKFIQIRKIIIFKALKVILAQVKSYHFGKSLSSFNRLVFAFTSSQATWATSPHNASQTALASH